MLSSSKKKERERDSPEETHEQAGNLEKEEWGSLMERVKPMDTSV